MKIQIILTLFLSLLLCGCILFEPEKSSDTKKTEVKIIDISGVGQTQEISSEIPVRLLISGVNNTITVTNSTTVQEIDVSGVDVKIKLPRGATPKITDSGIRTQIIYE